jgi:hypothetical protein
MAQRRSTEEIGKLLEGFRTCGTTRVEYCRQAGVTPSTLDYYRRRQTKGSGLVRVRVSAGPDEANRFALVLSNGRRIESGWNFSEAELAKLIRVAEAA